MGQPTLSGQQDRISYSLGVKINLGNYETTDLHFSYSSDVKEAETLGEAQERVTHIVNEKVYSELKQLKIKKATPTQTKPKPQEQSVKPKSKTRAIDLDKFYALGKPKGWTPKLIDRFCKKYYKCESPLFVKADKYQKLLLAIQKVTPKEAGNIMKVTRGGTFKNGKT